MHGTSPARRGWPTANTSASPPAVISATPRATCARPPIIADVFDAETRRHLMAMRCSFVLAMLLFATSIAGCSPQQPYVVAPQITDAHSIAARPLPYKGRLIEGDPTELP